VIGSFGFATPNKGFEDLVRAVHAEFDKAVIRFNIPSADFGDKDGSNAKRIVEACRVLITKPGISLDVSHDFLSKHQVLDFLAQNTLNVFLYQDKRGRGISSTTDYALAVDRPVAVSDSIMFRHLHDIEPSIVYGRTSLKEIIDHGTSPLRKLLLDWDASNLIWEYERIVDSVLKQESQKKAHGSQTGWKQLKTSVRKMLGLQQQSFTWLRNTVAAAEDRITVMKDRSYTPVTLRPNDSLNRILDNSARTLYEPAIKTLNELVPLTMAKKIPEANVQQAFVFDTVHRVMNDYSSPKILCVGSYEDTAAMSLKRMGYCIEEIDPVLNYYLQEYFSKPTTARNSYDIIFSTSVIEHDPDDESFVQCINDLLAPGGVAIITCDYNDQWKPGDPKPEVDARLYTQRDLRNRLMPLMAGCELVDDPQWDCPSPDFNYLGKYQYTFATLVVKKTKHRTA
jgi:SAM-dependent methyltransferase